MLDLNYLKKKRKQQYIQKETIIYDKVTNMCY